MAIKRQASFRLRDKTWEQIDYFSTEWNMTPAQVVEIALEMLTVRRLPGSSAIEMMFRQLEGDVRHLNEHIDKARQIYYDAAANAPPSVAPIPAEPRKRGRKPGSKTSLIVDELSNVKFGHEPLPVEAVVSREIQKIDGSEVRYIETVKDAVHGLTQREVASDLEWGDNPVKVSYYEKRGTKLVCVNTQERQSPSVPDADNSPVSSNKT